MKRSPAALPPRPSPPSRLSKQVFTENFDKPTERCVQPSMDHPSHEDIKGGGDAK